MHEPRMLYLHEPTQASILKVRRSMWPSLKKSNEEGLPLFLTTHTWKKPEMLCRNIASLKANCEKHMYESATSDLKTGETYVFESCIRANQKVLRVWDASKWWPNARSRCTLKRGLKSGFEGATKQKFSDEYAQKSKSNLRSYCTPLVESHQAKRTTDE